MLLLSTLCSSIMFAQGLSPLAVESSPQTSTQKPVEYISPIQPTTNQTSNQSGLPNGTSQYDKFGVLKIYPTKNAGEEWLMDMDNPDADKRFDPQDKITRNTDGSWKMRSKQVRMGVFPSTGYDSDAIPTKKGSELKSKGYMARAK